MLLSLLWVLLLLTRLWTFSVDPIRHFIPFNIISEWFVNASANSSWSVRSVLPCVLRWCYFCIHALEEESSALLLWQKTLPHPDSLCFGGFSWHISCISLQTLVTSQQKVSALFFRGLSWKLPACHFPLHRCVKVNCANMSYRREAEGRRSKAAATYFNSCWAKTNQQIHRVLSKRIREENKTMSRRWTSHPAELDA